MNAAEPPLPANARHLLIQASAGSGKTQNLVGRVLRLMLAWRQPEQIIALTFTRKAAGEFFDRVLGSLAEAAASPEGAAKISRDYEVPGLDQARALELLRLAADSLHRLSLGTLDSFFARVLRAFPAEFGIGGDFTVLDEAEAAAARQEVIAAALGDLEGAGEFLHAFQQATFGAEEKKVASLLEDFVARFHQLYLECPARDAWSRASAIWPEPPWWLTAEFDPAGIAERLRDAAGAHPDKRTADAARKAADALPAFARGATGNEIPSLINRALDDLDRLRSGASDTIFYYREQVLGKELREALADAAGLILQREIVAKLAQTQGIHEIIRRHEALHHQRVRRSGRLGFDDILVLLSGGTPEAGTAAAARELSMLDAAPGPGENRLRVDYRLDGRYHHWLIDEFQDTGRRQWQVLRGLIDEVIDDDSGERSFYYVGDEKQAIYGWRGGDSRLFHEIRDAYNLPGRPAEQRIHSASLDESWRSGPVILRAVNLIFGNCEGLAGLLGPDHSPVIRERWEPAGPGRHRPSILTRERPGHFRFLTVEDAEGLGKEELQEARRQVVLETLRSLDPVASGISVAVLCRRGNAAAALADHIRRHASDLPVIVEGKMHAGKDHPVATAFRALLRCAAHPGDTAAWEHVAMSPALLGLDHESLARERRRLPAAALEILHDQGFHAAFAFWMDLLEAGLIEALDPFSRRRADQIAEACRRFDLRGSRSVEEFLSWLDHYQVADSPSAGTVQIMTIHMAKGLTFDAVIVADLKTDAITSLRSLDALKGRDEQRALRWVLVPPKKDLSLRLEPLRSAYLEAEMDRALEELCCLYVALTRARHATHVITEPLAKAEDNTSSRNLLAAQLAASGQEPREEDIAGIPVTVRYEDGGPGWIAARGTPPPTAPETAAPAESAAPPARRRFPLRPRRAPSSAEEKRQWGGPERCFAPREASPTELGSAVHALFECLDWIDEMDPKDIEERWRSELERWPAQADEALRQARASLAAPGIRGLFLRSTYRDPVTWQEKRFEMITPEGSWISGVFDRVALERGPGGGWISGHIIDFKTNQVSSAAEIEAAAAGYRSQMSLYRAALARLTGLPETAITSTLVFTRPGVLHGVE